MEVIVVGMNPTNCSAKVAFVTMSPIPMFILKHLCHLQLQQSHSLYYVSLFQTAYFNFEKLLQLFLSIASCENHLLGLIGDSVCDDIANTEVCSFDGGDCCYKDSDFGTCSNCTCYVQVIEIQEEESQIKNDLPKKKKKKKKKKKSSAAMRNLMVKTYNLISTLLFVTLRHP